MKKLLIITGSIALLSILINIHTQAVPVQHPSAAPDILPPALSQPEEVIVDTPSYWLKEYDKRIAVFAAGTDTPVFVSEVYVSELPKADQRLLKNGIPAQNKKELTRLMEDYCS